MIEAQKARRLKREERRKLEEMRKSEALARIGYLDEIFEGGNFEDDDYCMRIHKKGVKSAMENTTASATIIASAFKTKRP